MTDVKTITLGGNMYNIMHGINEIAPLLLKILDLTEADFGRFRDIYLNEDGTKIIALTRNGGGNREEYQDTMDELSGHPDYLTDYDDDFDCTYAYVEFSVPEKYKEEIKKFSTGEKPKTLEEKTNEAITEMKKLTPEQVRNKFPELTEVIEQFSK